MCSTDIHNNWILSRQPLNTLDFLIFKLVTDYFYHDSNIFKTFPSWYLTKYLLIRTKFKLKIYLRHVYKTITWISNYLNNCHGWISNNFHCDWAVYAILKPCRWRLIGGWVFRYVSIRSRMRINVGSTITRPAWLYPGSFPRWSVMSPVNWLLSVECFVSSSTLFHIILVWSEFNEDRIFVHLLSTGSIWRNRAMKKLQGYFLWWTYK